MTMEMELSHTKNEYTFLTTRNFVKILSVNTTILSLLDILDDTRPKNSLLETTGGHVSKVPFGDISTNVNHAKGQETIEKSCTTRFTHMLFPRNPGNTSRLILLVHYQSHKGTMLSFYRRQILQDDYPH